MDIGPFDVAAGETLKIDLDFNFQNDDLARDWSVIVFGEDGSSNLSLKHSNPDVVSDPSPFRVIPADSSPEEVEPFIVPQA